VVAHHQLANVILAEEVASVDANLESLTSKNFKMRFKVGKWLSECFIKKPMGSMR
jgi:hypothetical protein